MVTGEGVLARYILYEYLGAAFLFARQQHYLPRSVLAADAPEKRDPFCLAPDILRARWGWAMEE